MYVIKDSQTPPKHVFKVIVATLGCLVAGAVIVIGLGIAMLPGWSITDEPYSEGIAARIAYLEDELGVTSVETIDVPRVVSNTYGVHVSNDDGIGTYHASFNDGCEVNFSFRFSYNMSYIEVQYWDGVRWVNYKSEEIEKICLQ